MHLKILIKKDLYFRFQTKLKTMRNLLLLAALLMIIGCSGPAKDGETDQNVTENQIKPSDTLDALFSIADEKQLKEVYGEKNVRWDTIWGGEGEMSMGTVLYPKTADAVNVNWENMETRSKVVSIVHACQYNMDADRFDLKTRWYTKAGVRMGTTLNQLLDINGKDFTFYGLGWDYGGGVSDWKNGKLAKQNIFVTLGVEDVTDAQQKDYEAILGDSEFSSALPAARKLNPLVFEIILSKE